MTPLAGVRGPERTASVPVPCRLATHFFRLGDMAPQAIKAGTRLGSYMVKKRYARCRCRRVKAWRITLYLPPGLVRKRNVFKSKDLIINKLIENFSALFLADVIIYILSLKNTGVC
jgi:hypothetical protein